MNGTRNSSLLGKITVIVIVGCSCLSAQAKYGGGTGEPNDPYLIYDANQMQAVGVDANDWDKCFKLMADIDLGGFDGKDGRPKFSTIGYASISTVDSYSVPFTGSFDGNNHEVSNFTYTSTDSNDYNSVGLFGDIDGPNSEIKNLGLIDPNVTGNYFMVGSLVGRLGEGTISNCYAEGCSVTGRFMVGGLVGADGGTITNCYTTGRVSGYEWVGGLVGNTGSIHTTRTISNCYSNASVSGSIYVGGLIGTVGADIPPPPGGPSPGTIVSNCYSTGSVSGTNAVGGLVGGNYYHNNTITNCYSTSSVLGGYLLGGLVGENYYGTIINCFSVGGVTGNGNVGGLVGTNRCSYQECSVIIGSYWDIETSSEPNMCGSQDPSAAGCDPNYGKTTAEMMQQSTFTDWDFINVWNIGENQTYPYLRICLAGDINHDRIVNFLDFAIIAGKWMEEYNMSNRRPEVLITYPEDGDRLMVGGIPPQTLIMVEAEDYDGTVVRVEFFDGEMKLGEDNDGSDGWNYLWQGYSLGWHVLTATAWDEEGLSGTSAPVNVEVWMPYPPPP